MRSLCYLRLTTALADATPVKVGVERPILHIQIDLNSAGGSRHVINVHLKAKILTDIPGQKIDSYTWRSADACAEGVFLSSMKRMSQALEVRRLVDQILDADVHIVVAGDFNATLDDVAVLAIGGQMEDTGNRPGRPDPGSD